MGFVRNLEISSCLAHLSMLMFLVDLVDCSHIKVRFTPNTPPCLIVLKTYETQSRSQTWDFVEVILFTVT